MAKGDMFLKVEGARSGTIKGESIDAARKDEIDVLGWSWGMRAQSDMSGSGTASKASLRELDVRKTVDTASTALMSAMRNNEPIRRAVLTVRKAGGQPVDYLKITIETGRITSIDVESAADGSSQLVERVSFSFQKIGVEYVPQGADGLPCGSMLFETETL